MTTMTLIVTIDGETTYMFSSPIHSCDSIASMILQDSPFEQSLLHHIYIPLDILNADECIILCCNCFFSFDVGWGKNRKGIYIHNTYDKVVKSIKSKRLGLGWPGGIGNDACRSKTTPTNRRFGC